MYALIYKIILFTSVIMSLLDPYYQPPKSFFKARIDVLSHLAKMRLSLLRELSKINSVYNASAQQDAQLLFQ